MEHPLPTGTIVNVTDHHSPVEVEDYIPGYEAEPPGLKGFYYLNSPQGFNDVIRDEDDVLEVVATPEEARARRVPTREQVAILLSRLCGAETDVLGIDEEEHNEDEVILYGENEYGSRFAVTIPMSTLVIRATDY